MAGDTCGDFLCPGDPLAHTASVYVPILICFFAFSLAFGLFCRWMGIRRRRRLNVLEALQWEDSEQTDPIVHYGEKPSIYDISLDLAKNPSVALRDAMPLSVRPAGLFGREVQRPETHAAVQQQLSRFLDLPLRLVALIPRRLGVFRHDIARPPAANIVHDELSLTYILAMPHHPSDSLAREGVLPELQLGFENLGTLGNTQT